MSLRAAARNSLDVSIMISNARLLIQGLQHGLRRPSLHKARRRNRPRQIFRNLRSPAPFLRHRRLLRRAAAVELEHRGELVRAGRSLGTAPAPDRREERADDAGVRVDEVDVPAHDEVRVVEGECELRDVEEDRESKVARCDPEERTQAGDV